MNEITILIIVVCGFFAFLKYLEYTHNKLSAAEMKRLSSLQTLSAAEFVFHIVLLFIAYLLFNHYPELETQIFWGTLTILLISEAIGYMHFTRKMHKQAIPSNFIGSHHVISIPVLLLLFAFYASVLQSFADDIYDPGPPPTKAEVADYVTFTPGVQDFLEIYWHYKPNKAFASSPDGVYGYSSEEMSTPTHAATAALNECEEIRRETEFVLPCRVVNINGKWQ